MYIRTKEEALDALSAVLALPERREQIIQITVKIALCLGAEARTFMGDAAAGLIEGGLEHMRKKRQEMVEVRPTDGGEPIVLVDSATDPLLEAIGSSMDALRLADVISHVFPELGKNHARWEIARAIIVDEPAVQESVRIAVKERKGGDPKVFEQMQAKVTERVLAARPKWFDAADKLKQTIQGTVEGAEGEAVFHAIAIHEASGAMMVDLIDSKPDDALVYLAEVLERVRQLNELEERHS